MAFGQLQDYYLEHQLKGYDKATVAWLGSIVSFAEFSLAIFSGRFFDIHGARLLVVGCTVFSFVAMVGLACELLRRIFHSGNAPRVAGLRRPSPGSGLLVCH